MKKLIAVVLTLMMTQCIAGCRSQSPCFGNTFETENTGNFPIAVDKPVIYLYPETRQSVTIKLCLNGQLTCSYPAYKNGWTVTAEPDSTLTDANGQQYHCLYWEGIVRSHFDFSRGWCIKGEDTAAFLEDALQKLGLTRREANEFIVYWLPQMEQNRYNLICFRQETYTDLARLEITPEPDTLIRVFMTWVPSDYYVNLKEQSLTAPERCGFTVVEWGGSKLGPSKG